MFISVDIRDFHNFYVRVLLEMRKLYTNSEYTDFHVTLMNCATFMKYISDSVPDTTKREKEIIYIDTESDEDEVRIVSEEEVKAENKVIDPTITALHKKYGIVPFKGNQPLASTVEDVIARTFVDSKSRFLGINQEVIYSDENMKGFNLYLTHLFSAVNAAHKVKQRSILQNKNYYVIFVLENEHSKEYYQKSGFDSTYSDSVNFVFVRPFIQSTAIQQEVAQALPIREVVDLESTMIEKEIESLSIITIEDDEECTIQCKEALSPILGTAKIEKEEKNGCTPPEEIKKKSFEIENTSHKKRTVSRITDEKDLPCIDLEKFFQEEDDEIINNDMRCIMAKRQRLTTSERLPAL
jgi:hypothetical protein